MGTAALAALLLSGAAVRADSIPWGYSASSTQIFNSNNPIQTSSISFTGSSNVASGNSGIIIYNLTTASSASTATPDSFTNVPFNLSVTLTDIKATSSASSNVQQNGTINFSGLFNATNVSKSSLFPGNVSWTTPTTASVTLGADDVGWRTYTLSIASFTSPGQPGGSPGSILATVSITPADGPGGSGTQPPPSAAPEPTSLVLAGLGLPLVYLARRRKQQVVADVA
jgi:hypothetical protein